MPKRPLLLKTLLKRVTWLTLPLLLATFLALHVETDEKVSLESIPLKETKVVGRALHFIEKNYVEPGGIDPFRMLTKASRELERGIAPLIVREREKGLETVMGNKKVVLPVSNPIRLDDLTSIVGRLLGFIDLFYQGRLDERERLSLAMTGLVETLDPHSNYLPPKVYNEFKIGTKGTFGGLGIVIGIREGELTVISPLEGTPAYEAGLKSKDKIVQIGEESTINMDLTEAVERLRGPPGSKVSLVVNRSGIAAPLKFHLTRAIIKIQSVAGRLLEGKKTALIKVKNFQEDTIEQFHRTLRNFQEGSGRPDRLILDFRNNPGGLLDQAISLADYFLEGGVIVKTVGAAGEPLEREEARPGDDGEKTGLVVLVNEGSASASEIVAGALQLNDRALVIGNRTFGKGSVQTVYDLKDGSALKLTIAKYLTAQDRQVQSVGINPDIGLIPASIDEKLVDLFEDLKKRESDLEEEERDTQYKAPDLPLPPVQITYLSSVSKEKEDEDSSGKIELKDDFPVILAQKILESTEGQLLNRESLLKTIPSLLEKMKKEEMEKIQTAMDKIGINWSEGEKKGRPSGQVQVEILQEGEGEKEEKGSTRRGLAPGEGGFIRVTVENRGNAPFYRLAAVTRSDDPLFANLEFPFGRVNPQEKKVWKTPFKMPDFVHRRSVPVEFEFHEQHHRVPKPSTLFMQTEEPPTPLFQYRYSLLDDGSKGTSGNGNRRAERGETVGLRFKVGNTGKGESSAPVVNLKNPEGEGVFIEKGHAELQKIPPGGESEALLLFRIPRKGGGERLPLDLLIYDNHLGDDLTDRLLIPLVAEPPSPPPDEMQIPPVITLRPEYPPLVSAGESYTLKGKAEDDREMRHLTLFVGDEKILYLSAEAGEKEISFEKPLSLKKGANLITLAATDSRELTSRKQWIVWRSK